MDPTMKKIEAVIPEERLESVFEALLDSGASGFSYFTVKGRGSRARPVVSSGRGGRFESAYNVNSCIMVVVADNMVNKVVDMITSHASTGMAGEGKIFVYNVEDAIDVGTKKHGDASI
ncbi:MAG: P-II family nitrogen regulator [Nitrososphaera sp.]|jgi:nitrogen regulatory protein P-II 1